MRIFKLDKTTCKVVSLLTLSVFLCSNAFGMLPEVGFSVVPQMERPGFLQVEIPQHLASVEDVFEAPAKENPKLILHIQNIHGNYESQVQISKLLQYLYEKYGFKLIFAEGAAEKLNPELLRFFPDAERNKKLADLMTKNGELTGIEYFLIDGPKDVEAVGIEEAELYRKNYDAFRKVYAAKTGIGNFLGLFEARLETLSSRIFSPNTRRLLSEWRKFESGHRDFLPYVKKLAVDAKAVLNLDLESLFAQVEWPQITRLLALQSMEKDLDRKAADGDKIRLLAFLKEQNISPDIIRAIETLDEKKITMSRSDAQSRKEDLPRYLFERLVDEAGPKGFRFHDYPAFSLWAGHLILQNELDSKILFEEIEKVFTKILTELTVSEREKNLMELYRDEILLRKLMHLEVTRKEWERAVYRKDWMILSAMVNRIKKISDEISGDLKLNAEDWEQLEVLTGGSNLQSDVSLAGVLETSYEFYDFARKRESVFYETINKAMEEKGTDKAVLVTGGFHTDGLMDIFRENNVNASILMPRVTGDLDNSGYISTMLENKPSMIEFKTQTIEMIARELDAQVAVAQGRSEGRVIGDVLPYVLEVSGETPDLKSVTKAVALIAGKYGIPAPKVQQGEGGKFELVSARAEGRAKAKDKSLVGGINTANLSLQMNKEVGRMSAMITRLQEGTNTGANWRTERTDDDFSGEQEIGTLEDLIAHLTAAQRTFSTNADLDSAEIEAIRNLLLNDVPNAMEDARSVLAEREDRRRNELRAVPKLAVSVRSESREKEINKPEFPAYVPDSLTLKSGNPNLFKVLVYSKYSEDESDWIDSRVELGTNDFEANPNAFEITYQVRSDRSSKVYGSIEILLDRQTRRVTGFGLDPKKFPGLNEEAVKNLKQWLESLVALNEPFNQQNPIFKRSESRTAEKVPVAATAVPVSRMPLVVNSDSVSFGKVVNKAVTKVVINDAGVFLNGANVTNRVQGALTSKFSPEEALGITKDLTAAAVPEKLQSYVTSVRNVLAGMTPVLVPRRTVQETAKPETVLPEGFTITVGLGIANNLPAIEGLPGWGAPIIVSTLAGGIIGDPSRTADLTQLAGFYVLQNKPDAQAQDLEAALQGTLLQPSTADGAVLVVLNLQSLTPQVLSKALNAQYAMMLPYPNAKVTQIIVSPELKRGQKFTPEQLASALSGVDPNLREKLKERFNIVFVSLSDLNNEVQRARRNLAKRFGKNGVSGISDIYTELFVGIDSGWVTESASVSPLSDIKQILGMDMTEAEYNKVVELTEGAFYTALQKAMKLKKDIEYLQNQFSFQKFDNQAMLNGLLGELTKALDALQSIAKSA